MKHPFQIVLSNKKGDVLFTTSQTQIQVFDLITGDRIGYWVDEADTTESIKEKVKKEQERQRAENDSKEEAKEEPSKKKRKSNNSEPKVPTPGAGAPTVYNYIRALHLTNDEKYLIAATDSDKAAVVFEISKDNKENVLKLIKRQPFPKRPSSITSSVDSSNIILGDKFGDVYSVPIDSEAPTEISSESDPILGHVSMLTDVIVGEHDGKEYVISADRDEHIRVSRYPKGFVIENFLFGHTQFVSSISIPDFARSTLISGGGDEYLFSWDWINGKLIDKFNLKEVILPHLDESHLAPSKFQNDNNDIQEFTVSQILPLLKINSIAVLIESTKVILIFKLNESSKLSLDQIIELEDRIISISASDYKIIASVESGNDLLKSIDIETKKVEELDSFKKITENSQATISSKEEVFPLYTTYQLRKRGEH